MEGIQDSMDRLRRNFEANANKRKRFEQTEARYTLIWHEVRQRLGLTINEYCLADTIHKLSGNHSDVPGWCYASKERLGKSLGVSRQSVHAIVLKLKKKDLVEAHPDTSYLRTTRRWVEQIELMQSKVHGDRKK